MLKVKNLNYILGNYDFYFKIFIINYLILLNNID